MNLREVPPPMTFDDVIELLTHEQGNQAGVQVSLPDEDGAAGSVVASFGGVIDTVFEPGFRDGEWVIRFLLAASPSGLVHLDRGGFVSSCWDPTQHPPSLSVRQTRVTFSFDLFGGPPPGNTAVAEPGDEARF